MKNRGDTFYADCDTPIARVCRGKNRGKGVLVENLLTPPARRDMRLLSSKEGLLFAKVRAVVADWGRQAGLSVDAW